MADCPNCRKPGARSFGGGIVIEPHERCPSDEEVPPECGHCHGRGWVYVPVTVGRCPTVQRVRCNCGVGS